MRHAKKYEKSQLKRLAIWEWPSRTLKVITIAAIRYAIYHFLLAAPFPRYYCF